MKTKTKRYGLDLDIYLYAQNDIEAKAFTKNIVAMLNQHFNSNTNAKQLVEIPFGSLTARKLKL